MIQLLNGREREDEDMIAKLSGCNYLLAYVAKYHKYRWLPNSIIVYTYLIRFIALSKKVFIYLQSYK